MKALDCLAVAALYFPFAETPQPAPVLKSNVIAIPIAGAPEPDRRCSLPGELQQCIDYCGAIDKKRRPEPGWGPGTPILLRAVLSAPNPWEPQQSVYSCDVRTIGGFLSLVCVCFNPGNQT